MSSGHDRVEQIADSAWSKILARFGTVIAIPVIGYFLVYQQNANQAQLQKISEKQDAQAISVTEIRGDLRRIDDKIDATVLYQVSDLRRRVEQLEAATKTP